MTKIRFDSGISRAFTTQPLAFFFKSLPNWASSIRCCQIMALLASIAPFKSFSFCSFILVITGQILTKLRLQNHPEKTITFLLRTFGAHQPLGSPEYL